MKTRDQIAQWANRMCYKGNIPLEFRGVCNQKTELIWCQIMNQSQPKQEVEYKKRIVLLYHLNKLQTKRNVKVDFPIKALEVWKKKQELEKEIAGVKGEIILSEQKADQWCMINNQLYIKNENAERTIQEYEGKEYLLKKFLGKLEEEIISTKEMVDHCVSLTPVESDDNNHSVLDDLNCVAEKLNSLILSRIADNKEKSNSMMMICGSVTPKFKDSSMLSIDFHWNETHLEKDVTYIKENSSVEEISAILRKHNRLDTWHKLRRVEDDLEQKIWLLKHTQIKEDVKNIKATKLEALHVKKALEVMKYKIEANCLEKKIKKVENDIYMKLLANKCTEEFMHSTKSFIQNGKYEKGFNAAIATLKAEYIGMYEMCGSMQQLQLMKKRIQEMEYSYNSHIQDFIHKYCLLMHMHHSINTLQEDTVFSLRKLKTFTEDLSWMEPLTKDIASQEVLAFRDFSLHHNQQFTNTSSSEVRFVKDCLPHTIPFIENMSEQMVADLALVIETPFHSPDFVLRNVVEKKVKLEKLETLEKLLPLKIAKTKYSAELFAKHELKLDNAIEKIMYLIRNESKLGKQLSKTHIQEKMDLWQNMPAKEVMLPTRQLDGHPYQYYEDLYESYYKQL